VPRVSEKAQGIAAALFEELVYDRGTGQLVNGTMVDYFMPRHGSCRGRHLAGGSREGPRE
jgi:Molybdopterin-binding domain of aldehyde dehydrogenase